MPHGAAAGPVALVLDAASAQARGDQVAPHRLGGAGLQGDEDPIQCQVPGVRPQGAVDGGQQLLLGNLGIHPDEPVVARGQGQVAGLRRQHDDGGQAARWGGGDGVGQRGRGGPVAHQQHLVAGGGQAIAGATHDLDGDRGSRLDVLRPARRRAGGLMVQDQDDGGRLLAIDASDGVGALVLAAALRDPHAHPGSGRQHGGAAAQQTRTVNSQLRVGRQLAHPGHRELVLRRPQRLEHCALESPPTTCHLRVRLPVV